MTMHSTPKNDAVAVAELNAQVQQHIGFISAG